MRISFFISLLFILSCKAQQPKQATGENQQVSIDGRWTLIEVDGQKSSELSYNSPPYIEIKSAENRISGSDGCNNFFGQLEQLDAERIEIGLMGSTKAYCPEIKDSDQLGQYLNAVRTYRISGKNLSLYDAAGKQVLVFSKVE
jgi:heat shock protein HslJ